MRKNPTAGALLPPCCARRYGLWGGSSSSQQQQASSSSDVPPLAVQRWEVPRQAKGRVAAVCCGQRPRDLYALLQVVEPVGWRDGCHRHRHLGLYPPRQLAEVAGSAVPAASLGPTASCVHG